MKFLMISHGGGNSIIQMDETIKKIETHGSEIEIFYTDQFLRTFENVEDFEII